MTAPVTPETLTDAMLVHALARFLVAESFRAGGPRLDQDLARFVGHTTKAVGPDVFRELVNRGWLALPAAGQKVVTEIGRRRICAAINARTKGGG